MKYLMFGRTRVCMDEAGGVGGGGGTPPANEPPKNEPPANEPPKNEPPANEPPNDGEFPLGKGPTDGEPPKNEPPKNEPPKAYEEKDYIDGVKKDAALLGDDPSVQLDEGLVKAMAPTFKELGIAPEQASKLANALAKAQVDDAKGALKARMQAFETMKQAAMQKYTKNDFVQISAGIDKWFKPGGVMNNVIRTTELAADPEFLALMHHLGAQVAPDGAAGAGAGSGGTGGSPNTFAGISGLWK